MSDINSRLPTSDYADGATGGVTPSEALLVGGSDGTDLRAISTTSTGIVNIKINDASGTSIGPAVTMSGVNYLPVVNPLDASTSIVSITTQDLASTTAVGYANQSLISGTPTAGSAASFALSSTQTAMILISGTWTGTLSTEVSENSGITWEPRSIHVIGTSTFSSSITANVAGSMNTAGKSNVRVRATAAMTGTASVQLIFSDNPSNVYVANSIKIVDGSSIPNVNTLTIKAASTAAAGTDTSAVVAISPNSALPSGTNTIGVVRLNDGSGNSVLSINNQLETRDVLNISSQYRAQSVTTTAAEALGGATILANRKLLHITPTNGIVYWGYNSSVTTATGAPIFPNNTLFLSVTDNLHVYVIAGATTDVRIGELS